jgi:Nif-specific regulatory protein
VVRAAEGGTLLLDEIGDLPASSQAALLRVLQNSEVTPVGSSTTLRVDVRVLSATHQPLERLIERGDFRRDLLARLTGFEIVLPPLRERREDIPPLVAHFVDRFNKENRRKLKVSPDAMEVLTHCYWPGNVRELENCIERTATMVQGDVIRGIAFPCRHNRCLTQTLHHLDKEDAVAPIRMPTPLHIPVRPAPAAHAPDALPDDEDVAVADDVLRIGPTEQLSSAPRQFGNEPPEGERERLIWAMEQCAWVQAKAARLLRVTPRQLGYALRKYNIEVHKF